MDQTASSDGVRADSERLDQRQLIQGEDCGRVDEVNRHCEKRLHGPIDVNTENAEPFAAIGPVYLAGPTFTAREIWLDRAAIPRPHAAGVRRDLDHVPGDFVPQDSWERDERLCAVKRMKISAADSHSTYANECVACASHRPWNLTVHKLSRFVQDQLSHGVRFIDGA